MKRATLIMALILSLVIFSACSKKEGSLKIGITQIVEHGSLDEVKRGFVDRIKELGIEAEIIEKNAQGEISASTSIANEFVDSKVDLIFAISTQSAQSTLSVTDTIPVIFSAVTDPVSSKLVDSLEKPGHNVTGTTDLQDIKLQLALFNEVDPSIKTVGILYNTSESNSKHQVDIAKSVADEVGLKIEAIGVNGVNELPQALSNLMPKIDAMYIITDNMVASSLELISQELIKEKKISIAAFEDAIDHGAAISYGLNYYDLGVTSADMAKEILIDKKEVSTMAVKTSDTYSIKLNQEVISEMGIEIPKNILEKVRN